MWTCLTAAALIGALSLSTLDAHAQTARPWVDPPADLSISPSSPAGDVSDEPELDPLKPERELATSEDPDEPKAPNERAQVAGSDLEMGRQVEPGSDLETGPTAEPERREGVKPRPVQTLKRTAARRHRLPSQRVQSAELRRQNSGDTYR
jgi:hypothetical protein